MDNDLSGNISVREHKGNVATVEPKKINTFNNDLEKHKHVKKNEIMFRCLGEIMTPLSRNGIKHQKCKFKRNVPLTRAPRHILIKSFFLAIGYIYLHDLSHKFVKRFKLL